MKIFIQQLKKLFICAAALCLTAQTAIVPAVAQTKRAGKKTVSQIEAAAPQTASKFEPIVSETAAPEMTEAWTSGILPAPLPVPSGSADETARRLAQFVAAKNLDSVPALLTALQLSGFFITGRDGAVVLAPPGGKGQGLTINGWEVAAAAKMLGDNRQTTLKDLGDRLRSIPALKNADVSRFIADGLRRQASNTENAFLRFYARFIIELGKNSPQPTDLTAASAPETATIDAVQHLLILRRLYGDVFAAAERRKSGIRTAARVDTLGGGGASFVKASYENAFAPRPAFFERGSPGFSAADSLTAFAATQPSVPCRMDGLAPTVMDAAATVAGVGFGELTGYLESALEGTAAGDAIEKYGKILNIANLLLAYAKFLQTYAALETKITMEDAPPLVRTKNSVAGERKRLKAVVRMNIGNWQMYNCIRTALNVTTGIDFATVNDGPIGGVGVTWHLDQGGAGDVYSNRGGLTGGEQFVGLKQDGAGNRIQNAGTSAGVRGANRVGNATYGKTDDNGAVTILLEGSPQKNAKTARALSVMKTARVRTTVKMKSGDLTGESVDVAGQVLGGVGGLITLPIELLYRMDWASTASLEVPVKDWEDCDGGWYGTITVTRRDQSSYDRQLPPSGYEKGSTNLIERAEITLNGNAPATARIFVDYKQLDETGASGRKCCSVSHSGKCRTEGDYDYRRTARTEAALSRDITLKDSGVFSLHDGAYWFEYSIGTHHAGGKNVFTNKVKNFCSSQNTNDTSESSFEYPLTLIARGEGKLDPDNPDVISGSLTEDDTTVTWNLQRCR